MARYSLEHKQATHERVLKIAGKLFREQGYVATGVHKLMKAAGLTHGGFYLHFSSKDGLLMEVLARTFSQNRKQLLQGLENKEGIPWLQEIVRRMISRSHRDCMDESCPTTTLATEVARSSDDVKEVFESEIMKTIQELEKKLPGKDGLAARDYALSVFALGIGAISLARAVKDKALSDQILTAARRFVTPAKTD